MPQRLGVEGYILQNAQHILQFGLLIYPKRATGGAELLVEDWT